MNDLFQSAPWPLLILFWFVVFTALSVGSWFAVRRRQSVDSQKDVTDYAGKLLSPIGVTFAFLIGFAATMSWSGMTAAQEAVDVQATSAQQVVWSAKAVTDKAAGAEIVSNLRRFLDAEVTGDAPDLARGDTTALPSTRAYDLLQDSIHRVAYRAGTTVPEAGALTAAASALTAAKGKLAAAAQRELPWLLTSLIISAGALLTLAVGATSAHVDRPYLMYGWAFISAVALSLIFAMDAPFGGAISVHLGPLQQVVNSL